MQNTDLNAIFTYSVLFNGYSIGSDDVNLQLINNTLNILDVIPIGALIRFSITYNTAN